MPRNTLFSLMKALKPEEMKDVAAFVKKEKPDFEACFQLLADHHPDRLDGRLKNEAIFAAAYDKKPFEEQKMRHLKMQLCRLLENYLIHAELVSDDKTKNELLTQALAQRNNYQVFKDYTHKRLQALDLQLERGKDYFLEKAFHHRLLYLHPETEPMDEGGVFLQNYVNELETAYAYTLLQLGAEHQLGLRNMQSLRNFFLDENGLQMAANKAKGHPPLLLFHRLFLLYANGQRADELPALLQLLKNCLSQLDETEKRMSIKLLANWPIPLANQGSEWHSRFIFDIFHFTVEQGLLVDLNGQVNPGNFANMVMAAVKVDQLKWAETLVADYARLLPEEVGDVVENLCLTAIYFKYGQQKKQAHYFKKALNQLGDSPQRIPERYNIRYRTSAIRACYELVAMREDFFDELEKNIKNFDRYLKKNRLIPEEKKQVYFRLTDYVKSLAKLAIHPDTSRQQVEKFLEELKNEQPIALQDWLEKKVEELLQSLHQ